MAEEKRCEKTDLVASQCSHCVGLDTAHSVYVPRIRSGMGFPANFESECRMCEQTIEPGDLITGTHVGYIHVDCE